MPRPDFRRSDAKSTNGTELDERVCRWSSAGILAFVLRAALGPAEADSLACGDLGLVDWETWATQVQVLNPGIEMTEIVDAERERLLDAMPCEGNARICPPDRVFSMYCTGNDEVLLAFETGGCTTYVGIMPLELYQERVEQSVRCDETSDRSLRLPDIQ